MRSTVETGGASPDNAQRSAWVAALSSRLAAHLGGRRSRDQPGRRGSNQRLIWLGLDHRDLHGLTGGGGQHGREQRLPGRWET